MNDKEDKMRGGKKNQTGLIGLIPLERQMCVAIILLHGQISEKQPAVGNNFAYPPTYITTTRH